MNRADLIAMFESYRTEFADEQKFVPSFLELLRDEDCFQRTHLPGHITGSAWIVNASRSKVVLVHHAKLNKWVQPGGHADGEENILNVALRETEEETGLTRLKPLPAIFDIDIHEIPQRKDFPAHLHYDIRFLIEADEKESIVVSDESHDVKWVDLVELEKYSHERSVLRMKEKFALTHSS